MISPAFFAGSAATHERAPRPVAANADTAYDAALVLRFNAGDESVFTEIIARHRSRIGRLAYSLLHNHADADEIAQDTFIRAYRGLSRFRGDASLASWLHRITVNLSRNHYGYFRRRGRHLTQSLDCSISSENPTPFTEFVASDTPCPARDAVTREFSAFVAEGMAELNAQQREILVLRNIRQHSYHEIARTLGIGVGTVKSRIARARVNLRLVLSKTYAEPAPGTSPASQWFEYTQPAGSCPPARRATCG